jgi:hypothetical protein
LAHQRKETNCTVSAISDVGSPSSAGTQLNIYWEPVDRRGRYRIELADGTVLAVSRQPFLDAARALISAGYSPGIVLFGWRKGSAIWSLRGRLGEAAKLTVDETKTCFARWKPFSSSAVEAQARSFDEGAVSPARAASSASASSQSRQNSVARRAQGARGR